LNSLLIQELNAANGITESFNITIADQAGSPETAANLTAEKTLENKPTG